MPILIPLLGLFGITVAVIGGENLAQKIFPPPAPPVHQDTPGEIPPVVMIGLVVVGGVLLYKYGAKVLKV